MGGDGPSFGFEPVSHPSIHTLVLGSLPSRRSIETGQYYGHPRNAFWPLMGALLGFEAGVPYPERRNALLDAGIGLWDVLHSSKRPGSLDADIDVSSARANDFECFLEGHTSLMRICFNGRKAADLFHRLQCLPDGETRERISLLALPSTSPAHAAMSFEEKLDRWAIVTQPGEKVR